jgi:hypothetical protein
LPTESHAPHRGHCKFAGTTPGIEGNHCPSPLCATASYRHLLQICRRSPRGRHQGYPQFKPEELNLSIDTSNRGYSVSAMRINRHLG